MKYEDADKLREGKSSLGQWIGITIAALVVSVGLAFLLGMVGFMLYDFLLIALPMFVIIGAFAALAYWLYRKEQKFMEHHHHHNNDSPSAHHS